MKTVKSPKLLLLAGLLSLALAGCGNSSTSKTTAPSTEQLFYTYTVIFGNHSSLYGAGYNGYGQLGNGSLATSSIFLPVAGIGPVQGYAAGANHVVAFTNNSTVWTWGSNFRGRLGLGTAIPTSGGRAYSPYPVALKMPNKVVSVAAGWLHSAAVAGPNRSVYAWGANNIGQMGQGYISTNQDTNFPPTPVPGLHDIEQVAAGGSHTLALQSDGTVWAWGDNAWGQAGPGLPYIASPTKVVFPDGVQIRKIAAAGSYSLALDTDDHVWGWGYNAYGQLGDGIGKQNLVPNYIPVQVVAGVFDSNHAAVSTKEFKAKDISAGLMHVLALVENGTKKEVWSWGFNEKGQLGYNSLQASGVGEKTLPITFAVKAYALDNRIAESQTGVSRIYAFGNQSFARIDGQWWGWGDNGSGEVGQPVDNKTLGYKVLPDKPLGL